MDAILIKQINTLHIDNLLMQFLDDLIIKLRLSDLTKNERNHDNQRFYFHTR